MDVVLLVELHHLLLLALLVVLVLGLDRLHLRRQLLHALHRAELLDGQREQDRAHAHRQQHDRPAPGHPDAVVEERQDRLEDVDQRLEDVRGDKHGSGGRSGRSGLEQPLFLDRIKASVAQRIAAQQPPPGQDEPAQYAVSGYGLRRVLRARGVVAAALADHRRNSLWYTRIGSTTSQRKRLHRGRLPAAVGLGPASARRDAVGRLSASAPRAPWRSARRARPGSRPGPRARQAREQPGGPPRRRRSRPEVARSRARRPRAAAA